VIALAGIQRLQATTNPLPSFSGFFVTGSLQNQQITMATFTERYGEELSHFCKNDDVPSLRNWAEQRNDNDWSDFLRVSTQFDAARIAKYCLQQGASPNLLVLSSMAACGAEHVHRVLIENGLNINEYIEIWKDALAAAVKHNNISWTKFCLDKGADPNHAKLDDYRSLLAEAAGNGNISIMRLLLDHGAERKKSGALIYAAEEGNADSIKFLLDQGLDINEIGIEEPTDPRSLEDVGTALHKAIEAHPELVGLLLATDMNSKDGHGRTPFELAEQLGRTEILDKLMLY
jgi:ankyrin repeat protein